ncbi:MAG: hypothetical protein AAGC74_10970, partial [Verrucomicrobiota bacterium]
MMVLVIRNEVEANQMYSWARRFAEGSHSELRVIVALRGKGTGELSEEEPKEAWVKRVREG